MSLISSIFLFLEKIMGVPESWTTIQKDWAKNGPEFFIQ